MKFRAAVVRRPVGFTNFHRSFNVPICVYRSPSWGYDGWQTYGWESDLRVSFRGVMYSLHKLWGRQ